MKKILLLFALLITIMLSACSKPNQNLTIRPSQFSKETQEVLKIFDDEIMFLDYTTDETIKSLSIDLWVYQNGEWINNGNTFGNIDSVSNQIALRLTETKYDLFIIDEEGYSQHSTPDIGTDFSNYTSVTSTRMTNPTSIKPNEEIPLWVKLGTNKNSIESASLTDFRNTDCDTGVAITVTFSDESVE